MRYLLFLFTFISCQEEVYKYSQENLIINNDNQYKHSTTAGNLVTTAIRQENNLDIVLYPSEFIGNDSAGLLSMPMNPNDRENILEIFPGGARDIFRVGYMRGRDLKTFIKSRVMERFDAYFEVAGLSYDILHQGGMVISEQFGFDHMKLDDDRRFLVAINDNYILPGAIFPPYKFRNSIERLFDMTSTTVSAKQSLKKYLQKRKAYPFLKQKRANVRHTKIKNLGFQKIHDIQGVRFLSPFQGHKIKTQGIVTAFNEIEDYPYGFVAYIQTQKSDNDPRTSEGIKLYFPKKPKIEVADLIEVQGLVYEESTNDFTGLTTTAIRKIDSLKIISSKNELPKAFPITAVPQGDYTSYVGNLHFKPSLNINEAIDFWESLEGMRVSITDPKIVGFRGGKETYADEKRHLTLYVIPKTDAKKLETPRGGVYSKPDQHIYNPDLLTIASGPLTPVNIHEQKGHLETSIAYQVGDTMIGEIEGLVTFTKNLFGEGEYLFQIPQESETLRRFNEQKEKSIITPLAERPTANYTKDKKTLSIAAYNIKNLSAIDTEKNQARLKKSSKMINTNLLCPDILGLVEIQDNNGEDFSAGSNAEKTIKQLINFIPKTGHCKNVNYRSVNIDPLSHREGGVPGANIRVALIFNQNRLVYKENPLPSPISETVVLPNGNLNFNPGRVFPNSEAFRNTRKSIVVQFSFQGKPVFIVVNHFNSKISDTSHFSTIQPVIRNTEIKRAELANEVNKFISMIEQKNPNALVAAIGDFNAYVNELPMKVLEGDLLYNLIREIPRNEWYTTNHNGNSQALDYIFVNKALKRYYDTFQIPQINSDYMGRLSDHDPVLATFSF
jgi:hypothetical protein